MSSFSGEQYTIFLVGCYVAYIYSSQLSQMVISNQINRSALQSEHRAYVNFTGITPGVSITGPDRKKRLAQMVYLNWYNSGDTPAKNAITLGNVVPWRGDLPDGYDFHDITPLNKQKENRYEIVVGPHMGSPIQMPVSIDNFRAQWAGTDRLFFYGWIVYRDVFKEDSERFTEFCTEMIQVTIADIKKDIADPTNSLSWNTQPCREHNCYDEDCRDYSARIKDVREK